MSTRAASAPVAGEPDAHPQPDRTVKPSSSPAGTPAGPGAPTVVPGVSA